MIVSSEPVVCILTAATLMALSGVPGVLLNRPVWGQRIAAVLVVLAAFLGEFAVMALISGSPAAAYQIDWPLPFGPALLSVDHLSTLFLLPLFLVAGCVSIYSLAYWPAREKASAGRLTLFLGLFAAAMVMVVMARHGVLFLIAWEVMALSAYFLLTTEQQSSEVQRVGTVYLIATHTGTMALFVMFSLLRATTGSYTFPAAHALTQSWPYATVIIIAALIGFGGKAGLMPLHFWLPGAHANAPSHVSAMMSGLMLKMGVYGILRTLSFFDLLPVWLGWLVLVLGAWSAVNGIALAAGQRDLKHLLACSSIENVGIIFIGIGLALVGLQLHAPYLVVCGLSGAFIHIVNHGLFKSLLFLGSGVLIHGTGTREIDRMGGLGRRMPLTTPLFLIGSLAICGLPPLNGFVGELFLYVGAITNGIDDPLPLTALVAPVLALVGGLAVITFVKLYGIIFLGAPRSAGAAQSHEAPATMTGPMALLALGCLAAGLAPVLLLRLVTPAVGLYGGLTAPAIARVTGQVPLVPLTMTNLLLLVLVLVVGTAYLLRLRRLPRSQGATWGCGYLEPTARMQYTGTSFSEMVVSLLGGIVAPQRRRPTLAAPMPSADARFQYEVTETVLDRILTPVFHLAGLGFSYLRRVQHGQLHIYVLYIFATLFVLMIWTH
ncbi:proton-conducting transporter transmembrane domain-containing protein [Geobacter argillaceus]|uniref:Hydrogenase-4 component B n=1 Tax=Geobacter argillaceus TaxID=345631 RepID=A0A562VNR6_9BACT|nr:proton-conducting transporter membrane subunit [Geobacter argillaceus]TWJ19550.1 hydrogenase-4 component B [Geobacter argillaceus]